MPQFTEQRTRYDFELLDPELTNGSCVIQAVRTADSPIRWNPDSPADCQFNLSGMLGNDNATFKWGLYGFEKTAQEIRLARDPGTGGCVLTAKLLNLKGEYKDAAINLDENLKVEEYVDAGTNETYHRLTESHHLAPERTLVLCFDGTSNQFGEKNTNVINLMELLKKDDPSKQMVYYQTGVGTYSPPGLTTSIGLAVASTADEAVAYYLYQHVIDGYRYLVQTYRIGDRIALFGFSRGAFTARAVAGMLHRVGLLPRHNAEHMPKAYEIYSGGTDTDAEKFQRIFSVPVKVEFVGVWDTVASVGALIPRKLPCIDYNLSIVKFRHALALDERRGNFIPSVWDHNLTNTTFQDVKEVWFKGEHSDIGGGAVPTNDDDCSMLSNISLRWMIRQILECKVGILFNHLAVEEYRKKKILETPPAEGLRPSKDWKKRLEESRKLDRFDIEKAPYDSIGWSLGWNGLEYLGLTAKPTKDKNFEPTTSRWPNAKAGREIFRRNESDPIYLHSSVVDQLALYGTKLDKKQYVPRAKWHGYKESDWPRVEEVSVAVQVEGTEPGAAIPEGAKMRLDIPRPEESKRGWGLFQRQK
ncbi:unnamed protein product [Rhizoctonia solani]|uniref:DUF2235 domain-containing protein n=1 Tax=Rhizoctonia solani TaxID=456999 RepID=A0A8H3AC65_9AGAM|nr:unnamed protein product [Rhizoctonia solani]